MSEATTINILQLRNEILQKKKKKRMKAIHL